MKDSANKIYFECIYFVKMRKAEKYFRGNILICYSDD